MNTRISLSVALPIIAALAVIALTISLGNWQMRRAAEKAEAQQRIDAAMAAAPLVLGTAHRLSADDLHRRVQLRGVWLDQHTVFIDNRTWRGQAGFHVVTPVKIEASGQVVLVLRGWTPGNPANRNQLPDLRGADGVISVEARVELDLPQTIELASAPAPGPNDRLWQNASRSRIELWSGLNTAPVVLRQTAGSPDDGLVRDWTQPGIGVDKHRAYAAQWYGLAGLTVILLIGLSVRRKSKKAS